MTLIKPDRSRILKEAALRSLNAGELASGVPLKPSQIGGLKGYYDFLNTTSDEFERRHAYADMATATGKTGMFSLIGRHAHRIAQEKGIGDVFRTLIVEPSVFLLKQTRDAFVKVAPELSDAVGIYGGDNRNLDRPITIISYESWLALLESGELQGRDIDLNINDEAHKGLSLRRQNMINQVLTNAHHIGVTASSQYDRDKTMALTHRNLFYRLNLKDAIEGGMLADYVHVQYGVMRLMPKEMKGKANVDLENLDFSALRRVEWSRLVTHAYRDGLDGITGKALSDKVAIFFASNTAHADYLAEMLNKDVVLHRKAIESGFKGVAVPIHTVGYTSKEQDRRMEAFVNGEYMVAVGDRKFQAGFDYPRVKLIASYPGSSLVDTVQEMGRATRFYIDPITGELQGAVILETIPYVGSADPRADELAYQKSMRDLVTAKEVLGGETLALRKGRPLIVKPKQRRLGVKVPLSSGATAEFFMTREETLTIASRMDSIRGYGGHLGKRLTKELLLNYIQATFAQTGKWPAAETPVVWQTSPDGTYEVVKDETWTAIDSSIRSGGRNLVDEKGSPLASSLADFIYKECNRKQRQLTLDLVKNYILTTKAKTGEWPERHSPAVWKQSTSRDFVLVEDETWNALEQAIALGRRGLVDKDGKPFAPSLARLIKQEFHTTKEVARFKRKDLTVDLLKNYIRATADQTGRWPHAKSKKVWQKLPDGKYEVVEDESWPSINHAIKYGHRGLRNEDGSLLAPTLYEFRKNYGLSDPSYALDDKAKEPLVAVSVNGPALPLGINFTQFASPFFLKADAAGDTMVSCLENAQKDFISQNRIGFRGNLRKFVELFIHHSLLLADRHIQTAIMPEERRHKALAITRNYQFTCAQVELSHTNSMDKKARLETGFLLDSFRDLLRSAR